MWRYPIQTIEVFEKVAMRIVPLLLAAAVAGLASPAVATERASKDDGAQAEEAKTEKKICRHVSTDMSSRRKERLCLTAEEWRQFNQGN